MRGVPSCSPATPAASRHCTSLRSPIALHMRQRVRDHAAAQHPAAVVEAWLRAGERLTEEQAAAIAFDDGPLDGLHE